MPAHVPRQMRARALYWVRIELSGRGPVWHCVVDRPPIACCDLALADVGLTSNDVLRRVPHDYFAWATTTTTRYHESADDVPNGLSIPR